MYRILYFYGCFEVYNRILVVYTFKKLDEIVHDSENYNENIDDII